MKLKEIHRTSTFAWSPTPSLPLIATGTVAGALDESFSNESQLEIWAPDFMDKNEYALGGDGLPGPKGLVTDTSRFNRLTWGYVNKGRSRGVIAAGMENGELALWDPSKILEHASTSESLIMRNTSHTGPVRGLDFNPIQTNLLSSGAVNGEVYIWDLNDPSKPYSPTPGTRSTKLDEITSLAWNQQVQYVLAGASSTGYTVVWDLRGKREVVALAYGGGTGTLAGQTGIGGGLAVGGRRGMSAISWHPDNATRLVTASEDDMSPVIMVWDLRNARAPEKILTGHEKGVLSLSWCKQDADLLLSCGKDNRVLCWNPQTSAIIGELPSADNWAFQAEWCPRNPDLLATAFFDGTIGIHSIQTTNEADALNAVTPKLDGGDVFDVSGYSNTTQPTLSLKQPPKWLRRPISSSFGFGGQLVSVSNLPSAQGKNQSSVVHLRKVVTEAEIVERVQKLEEAMSSDKLTEFAEQRSQEIAAKDEDVVAGWKALLSLFRANSRDELVTLLGYSKEDVAARVSEAVARLKETAEQASTANDIAITEEELFEIKPPEPVVSFAEPKASPEGSDQEEAMGGAEKTPSELSVSATSDITSGTQLADGESTTTAPSLFGDDNVTGNPHMDAAADFFSTMGIASGNELEVVVPHHNYGLGSSVAATIGSGPSSIASDTLKSNNFRIYPSDESAADQLITKALVLGDFESAVSLCLSSDRFADAILLAIKGGQDLLQRTQKAYFERRTTSLPYLRLFQSIVTNDLADIVQNADLQEWQEIFVVLCTFASQEEFANLAEQLGRRLEFQSSLLKASDVPDTAAKSIEFRKHATLTYLAAGRLERLVNIWMEELAEEEKHVQEEQELNGSQYTAHAHALQTFIEKVTVFRSAIKYIDGDLSQSSGDDAGVKMYKLAGLYDRYFEYADLLAAQGLVKEAIAYLKLTPSDYAGSAGTFVDFQVGRDRLLIASGCVPAVSALARTSRIAPVVPSVSSGQSAATYTTYVPAKAPQVHAYPTPAPLPAYQPPITYNNPYAPAQVAKPPLLMSAPPVPAAPLVRAPVQPAPPPKRHQENGGWNDAPVVVNNETVRRNNNANKPTPITSPFPHTVPPPGVATPGSPFTGPPASLPPPPRPSSVHNAPPPPQGQRMHPPGPPGSRGALPPHVRPPSGPPSHPQMPPTRMMSPPQTQAPHAAGPYAPSSSQTLPAANTTLYSRATPPPGPPPGPPRGTVHSMPPPAYTHSTPPPGQGGPIGHQQGQFNPASASASTGPYPPPPGTGRINPPGPPQHGGLAPPPPPQGMSAPPSVSQAPAAPPRAPRGPPPPKYPPGDRSHIPETSMPVCEVISAHLARFKQTIPPQQKRVAEDLDRRIGTLFDGLNCESLSQPVIDQLLVLTRAMEAGDRDEALAIHVDLLTRGSQTDDIGLWMSAIKQLIMRL